MKDLPAWPQTALRPPERVMRLARMGASFPTRLSFLRSMVRRLHQERVKVRRAFWDMSGDGQGQAVYTLRLGGRDLSLVAISQVLPPDARSDRVIATAWDAAFVLFDGSPDAADLARIAAEAPKQEAGRFCERDLVLSRANRSVRLWDHVVARLRDGQQPDPAMLHQIGYLMRTTAVYGNGKFGIADRHLIAAHPAFAGPFMAEMLTVWLIREFTLDLVEHVGQGQLDPALRRSLGVGNATGLGMAPFLVKHPVLLHNWMLARETGLARIRAMDGMDDDARHRLERLAQRMCAHIAGWHVPDPDAAGEIRALDPVCTQILEACRLADTPEALFQTFSGQHPGAEELVVALLLEAFPEALDGLADGMSDPGGALPPMMADTATVAASIKRDWGWALRDYTQPAETARFWYVSEAKLEPRIGARHAEAGAERESPLDVARRVAALARDLPEASQPVCDFLAQHPEHFFAIERVRNLALHPYSEIRDNLIAETCRPIDMLRAKLSFFGATRFDPKSDLWTRVTLAQGAPMACEVATCDPDDWWLPEPVA